MALYRVQSPYNAALQGMQGAAQTTSSMTKKQEVKEGKKSFGGAIGSMVQGGTLGLSAAELFSGGEATSAMWSGLQGAFGGAEAGAAGAATDVAGQMAVNTALVNSGAATVAAPAAAEVAAIDAGLGGLPAALAETGGITGGIVEAGAPAASAAGPIGWGLLGAGALLGLASYYL